MTEQRIQPRMRVLKAGTIAFNRAGGISCRVRNLNANGASLEVASPVGIPDNFILLIDGEAAKRPCVVRWRRGNRLGIAFVAA